MKSLKKNIIFNIIYTISNLLFLFVSSLYGSRILLAEGIGKIAYVQNIASYFITFVALGIPSYGIKAIANAKSNNYNINKVFTELFIINFISTITFTLLYVSLIFSFSIFRKSCLLFLCCGLPIFMNCFNIDWLYQGNEEYQYITIRSVIIKFLSLISILIFVQERDDYILYALFSSFAICGNYLFNIIYARKIVRFDFQKLSFKKHLSSIFILAISLFLSSAYSKIDITMLGSICSDKIVGLYSNAHKTVDIIITICTAVSSTFLPRLSCLEADSSEFLRLIHKGIEILCFIAIPACIGLSLLSPYLVVLIFGPSFSLASNTVQIFSLLIIIKSFGNLLCYQLIIITGNEKRRLPSYLVAAIVNILLNIFLIPKLEHNGAAIASVVSELIVNLGQFIFIKKVLKIIIPKKPFIQAFFSSVVMAISVIVVLMVFKSFFVLKIICSVFVGVIVYLIINLLIKNKLLIEIKQKILHFRKK